LRSSLCAESGTLTIFSHYSPKEGEMKKKVVLVTVVAILAIVWFWIMSVTAHTNCSDAALWETQGPCLWRRLAEGFPILVYLAGWTYLGGVIAKSKRRHQAIGWVLGFFFQFLGGLILLIMKTKLTPEEESQRELMKIEEDLEREMRKKYEKLKITWNEPKK